MIDFFVFFNSNDDNDGVWCWRYDVIGEIGDFVFYVVGIVWCKL